MTTRQTAKRGRKPHVRKPKVRQVSVRDREPENSHATIREMALSEIRPSPENDELYRPVNPNDPEIVALAESIRVHGVKEALVLTLDGYILSGHRRYACAKLAGLTTAPVRIEAIRRCDDLDEFVRLLREYNRQREKTFDEKLREELVTINSEDAYQELIDHRRESEIVGADTVEIEGTKKRARIGRLKQAMFEAVKQIILVDRREFWPMSVRTVHYALLNLRPLRNTNRADSQYANDRNSYQDLSNLLTRARLTGVIPWQAITDETRPTTIWNVWRNPRAFIRNELDEFCTNYWRDLMQSQPNHIEAIFEKNTIFGIGKSITMRYCIPTMSGRGFSAIDPYHAIYQRYKASGKRRLILIVASDHDPEGEEIVQVAGRTLRDDFGVRKLDVIKATITSEQIEKYKLPPNLEAKESSSRFAKFVERHGHNVYELEALTPEQLQAELTAAIDGVIDVAAFNHELDLEERDAAQLQGVRNIVCETLKTVNLNCDKENSDFSVISELFE